MIFVLPNEETGEMYLLAVAAVLLLDMDREEMQVNNRLDAIFCQTTHN